MTVRRGTLSRFSHLVCTALAGVVLSAPVLAVAAPVGGRSTNVAIAAAVGNADRPAADLAADAARKPAALLAFAGLRSGMTVADVMPGHGYFTRLFSNVVGKAGHVYAVVPASYLAKHPKAADAVKAIASDAAFRNVSLSVLPIDALSFPARLDMAWTSQNYHDVYYGMGADTALAFDKSVYAALKPGGIFIVIDHVAKADAGADIVKLHRIDPAIILHQAEAAGFQLQSQSKMLANPADPHDVPVFDPSIRGHTDQVVFKFRKPS